MTQLLSRDWTARSRYGCTSFSRKQADVYVTVHTLQGNIFVTDGTSRQNCCRSLLLAGHGEYCRGFPVVSRSCAMQLGVNLFRFCLPVLRRSFLKTMSSSAPTHVERTQSSTRSEVSAVPSAVSQWRLTRGCVDLWVEPRGQLFYSHIILTKYEYYARGGHSHRRCTYG